MTFSNISKFRVQTSKGPLKVSINVNVFIRSGYITEIAPLPVNTHEVNALVKIVLTKFQPSFSPFVSCRPASCILTPPDLADFLKGRAALFSGSRNPSLSLSPDIIGASPPHSLLKYENIIENYTF